MSSLIFQPLLHDPLGWKPNRSTYVDHYKWRKYRATSKDKKISAYGQQYQRKLQKQQQQQLANQSLPLTTNNEQSVNRVILVKQDEDQQVASTPAPYRYSPSKTPVYIVEHKPRSASENEDTTSDFKASHRPPTATAGVQGKRIFLRKRNSLFLF